MILDFLVERIEFVGLAHFSQRIVPSIPTLIELTQDAEEQGIIWQGPPRDAEFFISALALGTDGLIVVS